MRKDCWAIVNGLAKRELSEAEVKQIDDAIGSAVREMAQKDSSGTWSMSDSDRIAEAKKLAQKNYEKSVVRAYEKAIAQAQLHDKNLSTLKAVKPGEQIDFVKRKVVSLEPETTAIAQNALAKLDPGNLSHGKFFGLLQDPESNLDVVKAIYGEASSPEAATFARQYKAMDDFMLRRAEMAGIDINKNEKFRISNPWEPLDLAKYTAEDFVADARSRIAKDLAINPDGTRKTSAEIDEMLLASRTNIVTEGAVKRAKGTPPAFGSRVGSTLNAQREIYFETAEDWMFMAKKYGNVTNPAEMISSHVGKIAHAIAIAESFGLNADQNFKQLLDTASTTDVLHLPERKAKLDKSAGDTTKMFKALVHPSQVGNAAVAKVAANIRGFISGTYLGALFTATPDLAGLTLAARLHGIPSIQAAGDFFKGLATTREGLGQLHRWGMMMDVLTESAHRMDLDMIQRGPGMWVNEAVHKFSGLNRFDTGIKTASVLGVSDIIGKFNGLAKALDDIPDEGVKRLMSLADVKPEHWDVWRLAKRETWHGHGTLLTPSAIGDIPDAAIRPMAEARLADKLEKAGGAKKEAMISDEIFRLKSDAAEKLIEASTRHTQIAARGAMRASVEDRLALGMLGNSDAGTIPGEIRNFFLQFKSVPLGIFRTHWAASKELPNANWRDISSIMGSKQAYRAQFVAYSMLLGAVTEEIMSAINGQDPRKMNPSTPEGRDFWMKSLARGGGLGIYGDLIAGNQTKGGSGVEVLLGPAAGAGWSVLREYQTAVKEVNEGEGQHSFAMAGLRLARRNAVPFANIWYNKLAFNRLVYDQLSEYLSPGYNARRIQKGMKDGTYYWWEPGAASPDRAPDMERMLAGEGE